MIFQNGDYYDGEWRNGEPSGFGKGRNTVENGSVYEGYLKDGKPNGVGAVTDIKGKIVKGIWKDGKMLIKN